MRNAEGARAYVSAAYVSAAYVFSPPPHTLGDRLRGPLTGFYTELTVLLFPPHPQTEISVILGTDPENVVVSNLTVTGGDARRVLRHRIVLRRRALQAGQGAADVDVDFLVISPPAPEDDPAAPEEDAKKTVQAAPMRAAELEAKLLEAAASGDGSNQVRAREGGGSHGRIGPRVKLCGTPRRRDCEGRAVRQTGTARPSVDP